MSAALAFALRLLDHDDPVFVDREDFDGPHREAARALLAMGFLHAGPVPHPVPTCPLCGDGVPYPLGGRFVCNACRADVDEGDLEAWPLDREVFLRWLAGELKLRADVRRLDGSLWQLGTCTGSGGPCECFFLRGAPSEMGRARLEAYRDALVLYGLGRPEGVGRLARSASLLSVLRLADGKLTVADAAGILRARGNVRFEPHSGALWVGDAWLGDVPPGSKEYYFLRCLAGRLDRFVPYADIKREVLGHTGSRDGTEEATFCQGLKSRIKRKWVPAIDLLVATTNKGDGYRLRGHAEL